MTTRLVVGCMTGTSIDAIDAALVRIKGTGMAMRAEIVRGVTRSLGPLQQPLRDLADQRAMTAGEIAALSREFALAHVEVIRELLAGERAELISVHGQTVFHQPPVSWQMISAPVIAHALQTSVVFDLRAADLAAGGQGAPITPLSDWVFFADATEARAVANLGGFCNVTLLGPREDHAISGADVCACNHLLDTIARRVMGAPFDDGGRAAASAEPDDDALDDLLGILTVQSRSKRSLGTGDEVVSWIGRHWRGGAGLSGATLSATACEAIGQTLAAVLQRADVMPARLLLAGGGVKNATLVAAIESCCSCRVEPTDALGVPGTYRESAAMAVLGAMCQDRVPITLSAVTGVSAPPIAGVWVHV